MRETTGRSAHVWLKLCCMGLVIGVSGCLIQPPEIDQGLLTRYQRSIRIRSPQRRAGQGGLDLLRPVDEEMPKPLETVHDDLTGQQAVRLSLRQAVRMALAHSPEIRVVSFDPAISREEMARAAAAFDFVVFGSIDQRWMDRNPSRAFETGRVHNTEAQLGLRNTNILGGQTELTWSVSRVNEEGLYTEPNPYYESILSLEVNQPLLRTAGPDFNLAELRLAEIGHKTSYAQFREKVEEVVASVETAYWALVQARGVVAIQQEVLEQARETLRRVKARRLLDAREKLEVQQTVVAVEQRNAELIRAKKVVADTEEALARLISGPDLNLLSGYRIKPDVSQPEIKDLTIDPADQLVNAMRHSPLLEQARLAIKTAQINVRLAENETLPALVLTGSVSAQGLKGNFKNATDNMQGYDYVDYGVGLLFEYPLGNRAAKARLRQQKFELDKSLENSQKVADQIAQAVNEAVREVQTTHQEVAAQDAVVQALQKNLEGLQAALEWGQQAYLFLLELILRQQESLGAARQARLQAMVNHKAALARLLQITGTTLHQYHVKLMMEQSAEAYRPARPSRRPAAPATVGASGPSTTPATVPATLPGMPATTPAVLPR